MTEASGAGKIARPKVLVFRSRALAGSETFIRTQLRTLQRWQGVLVAEQPVPGGLPLEDLDVRWLSPRVPLALRRLRRRVPGWREGAFAADVALLRAEQARLMHVHFGTDALEAAPLARALGLPMLVTLHGFDVHVRPEWWEAGHGGRLMRRYPERLRGIARQPGVRFVAVSHAVREGAIAFGLPPERVDVSPIGVDLSRAVRGLVPMADRPRRVLFVGRLVEKKGAEVLLRALADPRLAGVEAVVIGEGPLLPALQAQASALGLAARVRFAGALPHDEVLAEMARARVYCLPSVTAANGDAEGLNTTVIEAQAAGVPVVTSARGSTTEGLLDGVTGLAFAEHDATALAAALARLLDDAALAQRMADAGPLFVAEHFDARRCTARLEGLYDAARASMAVGRPA
jgi:glycosyltransferase involved in cell wall biosynthesis